MRASVVLLSVSMGICCFRCPRSLIMLCMGTSVLLPKNNAPSPTPSDYDITLQMMVDRLRTAPLFEFFYVT